MRQVPAVVFDIGNVLLDWNPRYLYRTIFADEAKAEWFLSEVCSPAWHLEQDRGRPYAQAVAELSARHPDWHAEISAFDTRWLETISGPIPSNVAVLERLKAAGWPVYAITNFPQEKFLVTAEAYPFLNLFDGIVVSGRERLVKPDAAIYRLFLDRFGLPADACVFLDDSAANVESARGVGMQAIHVTPGLDIVPPLRALGVPA